MLWLGAAALLVCAAAGAYYVSLSRRRAADASPPPRKRRQRGRRKAARPPPRSGGERPPATASAVRRLLEDRWEIVAATRGGGERVRFCGFNVLADQFSYGQRGHCSRRALAWARRFDAALGVLERSGADVICLQECDHGREWAERLGALGYAVARAERPSTEDAVAIAWRRGAFSRVVEERIDFDDLVPVGGALPARQRRPPRPPASGERRALRRRVRASPLGSGSRGRQTRADVALRRGGGSVRRRRARRPRRRLQFDAGRRGDATGPRRLLRPRRRGSRGRRVDVAARLRSGARHGHP